MLTATALVVLMTLPGLALFYGGLVRSKNVLSVLMQVTICFFMISILWVAYGYSLAFTNGNAFIGRISKVFLNGVSTSTMAATFSQGNLSAGVCLYHLPVDVCCNYSRLDKSVLLPNA